MSPKFIKNSLIVLTTLFIFSACDHNPPPDVSHIQVDLQINRFEQDLFRLDPKADSIDDAYLKAQYPVLYPIYVDQIMRFGFIDDTIPRYHFMLRKFLQNDAIRGLYDTCQQRFPDNTVLQQELTMPFKYYKFHFPDHPIPTIATMISEFSVAAMTADSVLVIGLDMYLGKDYVYYQAPQLGFPQYKIRKFTPDYIGVNAMKAWSRMLWEFNPKQARLIDHMVYNGKQLYFLDLVMPETPDSIKIGLKAEDMEWLPDNEFEVWAFFIKHDLLYSTNMLDYRKYINDGPTTPGMPTSSPGNVGSWVGWQIVKRYMELHPNTTFEQLMQETDGQKILQGSKYKPEK